MNFLKTLLAVITGLFLFSLICLVLFIGAISILGAERKVRIDANSVLRIDLNRAIVEMPADDPFSGFLPGVKRPLGLLDIKRALRHAKTDNNIQGVLLDCGQVMAGYASLQELRDAILDFKESGKFVLSYSEFYTEPGYYLASAADEVMVTRESIIFEFNGLSYNAVFFKGLLDKLQIEPEVYRVGEYKGAVEPFTRRDLSPENQQQISSFINSIYQNVLRDISASRNIPVETLHNIAYEMQVFSAEDALNARLVDHLAYLDQVHDNIRERLDMDKDKEIKFVSIERYIRAAEPSSSSMNRIAVVVASGDIVSGKGERERVGSEDFVKIFQEIRKDKNIKAVVLRINSPGGSAMASDVIWREILLTREKKPVIASMSDLAASGGYYLAMHCDTIIANPTTITGSIGVFGLMVNLEKFLDDKLGITTDVVKTGRHSDMFNMTRPNTPAEKAMIQRMVDGIYETFVTKVSEGRKMELERVEEIAQGRVWTGDQALDNGLVDLLGNFEDAVNIAAAKAGIEDFRLRHYPRPKTFLEMLLEGFNPDMEARIMKSRLGEEYIYLKKMKELKHMIGIQARMPYDLVIR
jgi:protease IV